MSITSPIEFVCDVEILTELCNFAMALYQFGACPFCIKVTRFMHKNTLNIELRDTRKDHNHKTDLVNLGGKYQVPCLRIPQENDKDLWLYESDEIISYFKKLI